MPPPSRPSQEAPVRSMDEFKRRYLPTTWEDERRAKLTLEERFAQDVRRMLRGVRRAL